MKCKVCGKRFMPTKDMVYKVIEQLSIAEALTKTPRVFDVVDCPRCGCQVFLGFRLAPLTSEGADGKDDAK